MDEFIGANAHKSLSHKHIKKAMTYYISGGKYNFSYSNPFHFGNRTILYQIVVLFLKQKT